ncbi:ParB/RepB/Spo0J family partition protein [Streptomyces uncialis]|uniref:ParB/RepB/Spo0J family partition protein n=1 Tax=Streptomyces uncialis TaxID=1048205 RepID=UPI00386EBE61|nr:ParB/RepB/Spo0J family partition protein [Streptomyces uncialis]
MTPPQQRVTRGFSIDDEGQDSKPAPRRVRTRQQIMNGEGKRPPESVELRLLAHNPFNPRDELTELEETAESLKEKGQIQPVAVVRRAAFLSVHPDQEPELGEAEYVVIDGNRRLAAAGVAGLEKLRIDVNDDLAASAEDLLESALIANVHRVDVPPIDQAKALQGLVKVHGSQGKVAKRLGKTPAWVSQRLALLELTPELQKKVETGELKVEPARRIGRMPKGEQAAAAKETVNAVNTPRQRSPRRVLKASDAGETVNAVNTPDGETGVVVPADQTGNTVNGVNTLPGEDAAAVPDQRDTNDHDSEQAGDEAAKRPPVKMPWGDGRASMDIIFVKLETAERRRSVARYAELVGSAGAFVDDLKEATSPEFRREVADLLLKDL